MRFANFRATGSCHYIQPIIIIIIIIEQTYTQTDETKYRISRTAGGRQ